MNIDHIKKENLKPFNPKPESDYKGFKIAAAIIGALLILAFINQVKQNRDAVLNPAKDTVVYSSPPILNSDTMTPPKHMTESEIAEANRKYEKEHPVQTDNITTSEEPLGNTVADAYMDPIYKKVIYDSEQQFLIVQREGDIMQMYVHAGMVAAAYLQAKDEVNYRKWKKLERKYARQIGI